MLDARQPPPIEDAVVGVARSRPHSLWNEDDSINPDYVAAVSVLIAARDHDGLALLAGQLHEADLGALIEALPHDDRPKLVEVLGTDFDFAALTEIDDAIREEILEELAPETVAQGVREIDTDDAVYILEDLTEADQDAILGRLSPPERDTLQRSLDYPEGSAGRRMKTEVMAVPQIWTVGQTIDYMREQQGLPDSFYELYAIEGDGRLAGTVALDRLLRSKRPQRLGDLADPDRERILAEDKLHDAAQLFKRYNFVSAPVVDASGRVVGVLTVDDMVDVLDEEADDAVKALGGVQPDEELSDTVGSIARGRFRWLFVNLVTAFLAAAVMKLFEAELEKMVALAVLAPIVASQGGNAATQTMTVAVRALATEELGGWNMRRFITRELMVSLINGLAFALITGLVAALWFSNGGLGVVIGAAIVVNMVAAAMGGAAVPLILNRLGIDPAVSSGTFVTTVTDIVGFFAFLGIASLWFAL